MPKYPPRSRSPEDVKLRYLPDSPERITQSMHEIGYNGRLGKVVRDALDRAKRLVKRR